MPIEEWSDKIWLVQLDDEPALSEDLNHVKEKSQGVKEMPDIVLDFGEVTHINSSNLSQLLRLRKEAIDRNGQVVAVRCVHEYDSVMFISQGGMLVRVPARGISQIGRNTQGVRLVNLKEGDRLIAAARVMESEGGESADAPVTDPEPAPTPPEA